MIDNQSTLRQLEKLLSLIETDCAHYQQRRDNAFDQSVKDYYDKKFRRAQSDFDRINRRVQSLKRIAKE